MKKTTCRDLRGACDAEITAETAEQMGENCKQHVLQEIQEGDTAHKEAVEKWMQVPKEEQEKWFEDFKADFDSLADA